MARRKLPLLRVKPVGVFTTLEAVTLAMRVTGVLSQSLTRLTLFTRANCSLCDTAKNSVAAVRARQNLDYHEIDVMAEGQKQWKDMYEFDTPVLHVQPVPQTATEPDLTSGAKKLWHRFSAQEIEEAIKILSEKKS